VLVQKRATTQGRGRRSSMAAMLSDVGTRVHNPKLIALALAVRIDPLTRVRTAIDQLILELQAEKKQEAIKRDSCIEHTNENERLTEQFMRDQTDLQSKIDGYESTVKDTTERIATLQKEIAEMNLQIKRKGEDRELENKDFQTTVADQREMQRLLSKALQVLRVVYKSSEVVASPPALLQQAEGRQEPPPPPPGFSTYGQGRVAGGVIGLMEGIVSDTKAMETETLHDEQQAQEEYERVVKDLNASIQAKQQQMVNEE